MISEDYKNEDIIWKDNAMIVGKFDIRISNDIIVE